MAVDNLDPGDKVIVIHPLRTVDEHGADALCTGTVVGYAPGADNECDDPWVYVVQLDHDNAEWLYSVSELEAALEV